MTATMMSIFLQASMLVSANSYEQGYRQSIQSGRPLLVLIGAEWCGPCLELKRTVLPQLRRKGLLDKVVFVYVDVDQNRPLAKRLGTGRLIPQMVLYRQSPQGWRRTHLAGGRSAAELEAFIVPVPATPTESPKPAAIPAPNPVASPAPKTTGNPSPAK